MRWLPRITLASGTLMVFALIFADCRAHTRRNTGELEPSRLREKAAQQKAFLSRHGFNDAFCFLIDMRLPSGKARFFVYDLHKDTILLAGVVAHGCGNRNFSATPEFSNADGSSCTALGRYRIGYPYKGQFGLAYKLYGLDSTNDQAFRRNIVLHSYDRVPEKETWPDPICNSRGCPMVSPGFLKMLRPMIDHSTKPICLWVFD